MKLIEFVDQDDEDNEHLLWFFCVIFWVDELTGWTQHGCGHDGDDDEGEGEERWRWGCLQGWQWWQFVQWQLSAVWYEMRIVGVDIKGKFYPKKNETFTKH